MGEGESWYWLIGILEGEGWFSLATGKHGSPVVGVKMRDEAVIARVAALCGRKYYARPSKNAAHSDTFETRLYGAEALALMEKVLPYMCERRQRQIEDVLKRAKTRSRPQTESGFRLPELCRVPLCPFGREHGEYCASHV
jgi:hypothetical protein